MAKKEIKSKVNQSDLKKTEHIQKKTPFWFYGVLILIPLLFLTGLELTLRYFNYGYDFKEFISIFRLS